MQVFFKLMVFVVVVAVMATVAQTENATAAAAAAANKTENSDFNLKTSSNETKLSEGNSSAVEESSTSEPSRLGCCGCHCHRVVVNCKPPPTPPPTPPPCVPIICPPFPIGPCFNPCFNPWRDCGPPPCGPCNCDFPYDPEPLCEDYY